eukprot:2730895-Prymnesium_polylepis.1
MAQHLHFASAVAQSQTITVPASRLHGASACPSRPIRPVATSLLERRRRTALRATLPPLLCSFALAVRFCRAFCSSCS